MRQDNGASVGPGSTRSAPGAAGVSAHPGDDPSREALLKAREALNAWLGTYAQDLVSDDILRRADAAVRAGGGTLSYIAECQRMIAFALRDSDGSPKGGDAGQGVCEMHMPSNGGSVHDSAARRDRQAGLS